MNPRSLHEIATGKSSKVHRTGQPVRRKSYEKGTREHHHWRRFDPSERNARMRAAEMLDRKTKQPGRRNGAIGHVGLEVYRELMRMVCFKTGRLDPSIETICDRIGRSRDAVCKAMDRLRAAGFLDWIRRFEPVEDPDPFGPQVKQSTNAYWLPLAKEAAEFVRRILRQPTEAQRAKADERQRHTRTHNLIDTCVSAEEIGEVVGVSVGGELGRILKSIGAGIDRTNASSPDGQNPALQG